MKLELSLTQKQTLSLSPKMQQAIRLLQLSAAELETEINQALEANPVLELEPHEPAVVAAVWDEPYLNTHSYDADPMLTESLAACPTTLRDYLTWQLNLTPFTNTDKAIAYMIIDAIDDDGYLTIPIEEIHSSLVQNYLDLFGSLELSEVMVVLHRIKQFDHVIDASNNISVTEYLTPDLIIEKTNDRWTVSLNSALNFNLRINREYAALDNKCLRSQYKEAEWLLNSIKIRNQTLLKVAGYIMQYQVNFLEHGEIQMRALNLHTIATDLQLHPSTISRVTNKKYIHTPRGIFELKYFLSSHVANVSGGNCSSTAIKAIIKSLIEQESANSCLSDQQIMQLLAKRGIIIARRTVSKYREAIGIKPSTERGD